MDHLLECDTRKEAAFSQSESGADGKKTRVVLDQTHETARETPHDHNGGNPNARARELHHHVGRDLGQHVEGEEDGQGNLGERQ